MESGNRGGWFRRGTVMAALAAMLIVVSACGSAAQYSSTALDGRQLAQAGFDPNRPSTLPLSQVPEELAFVDEAIDDSSPGTSGGADTDGADFASAATDSTGEPGPESSGSIDTGSTDTGSSDTNVVDSIPAVAQPVFEDGSTPAIAEAQFQRCVIDYREIEWNAPPSVVVDGYTAATSIPCANTEWFAATALQNGTLLFTVLSGEAGLSGASPTSGTAEEQMNRWVAQGLPQIAEMEIASTGACENGDIQLASVELRPDVEVNPAGMDQLLASAAEVGALVDQRGELTLIAGGGSPCISGIVIKPGLVAWLTSRDASALISVAETLSS